MTAEVETPWEFEVGVTELRESLGFTVREVARSGNPVIVRRYTRADVILVPLSEWRRLKQLAAELESPDPFTFDDDDPVNH
jgi:prevent-host-death family protein